MYKTEVEWRRNHFQLNEKLISLNLHFLEISALHSKRSFRNAYFENFTIDDITRNVLIVW